MPETIYREWKPSNSLDWDDEEGQHSFNPIHRREPIKYESKTLKVQWSADQEQKRAAIGYTIVLLIVVAFLVIFLKGNQDACVLTGSDGSCISN